VVNMSKVDEIIDIVLENTEIRNVCDNCRSEAYVDISNREELIEVLDKRIKEDLKNGL